MSDPKITVIIPVYQVEKYLARCVDSVLNQSYPNLEILLVDDGSPDRCGAMCDDYARQDSRVRVIHKENGGLSSARNAGLDCAAGDYIAFVDSDDWLAPDYCRCLLDTALRENVKLVCCGRWDVEDATGKEARGLCPSKNEVLSGQELVRRIFYWENLDSAAWDKLYHASLFSSIRYPEGVYYEDLPTTYRLALLAGRGALVAKPMYYYRHREGSITVAHISPKTFALSEHARNIYDDIRQREPKLEPAARFFLTKSLYSNVLLVDIASPEEQKTYAEPYRACKKELAKNLPVLLKSPHASRQTKVTALLMTLGLYRRGRRLYHRVKGQY